MNTTDYLLEKYGLNPNLNMPQVIPGTIRQNLYQLFAQRSRILTDYVLYICFTK